MHEFDLCSGFEFEIVWNLTVAMMMTTVMIKILLNSECDDGYDAGGDDGPVTVPTRMEVMMIVMRKRKTVGNVSDFRRLVVRLCSRIRNVVWIVQ